MSLPIAPDCLICRKHCDLFPVLGEAIYENELIYANHANITEGRGRFTWAGAWWRRSAMPPACPI